MSDTIIVEPVFPEQLEQTVILLGGPKVLRRSIRSQLDAHELLSEGLPNKALQHLVGSLLVLTAIGSVEKAIGMSYRTLQRKKDKPEQTLDVEQSGRAWKFAELLTMATGVFGSQKAAESWFESQAIGLNRKRPIDLVSTPAGQEMVETYLRQLQYGVYV